jgi:hypothetical protein
MCPRSGAGNDEPQGDRDKDRAGATQLSRAQESGHVGHGGPREFRTLTQSFSPHSRDMGPRQAFTSFRRAGTIAGRAETRIHRGPWRHYLWGELSDAEALAIVVRHAPLAPGVCGFLRHRSPVFASILRSLSLI